MTYSRAKWGGATQNVRLYSLRHAQSSMPGCPRSGSYQPDRDQDPCRRPGLRLDADHSVPCGAVCVVSESLSKLTFVPRPSREKFGSGSKDQEVRCR